MSLLVQFCGVLLSTNRTLDLRREVGEMKKQAKKQTAVGTCGDCGADTYDAQPVTCCVRNLLGYLECVLAHAAETLRCGK